MKRTIIILIIGALIMTCSDKLELLPEDALTLDVAFSNEELALGVLTGTYGNAQFASVLNGVPQLMGDWQADNIDFVGSFPSFNEIKFYSTLATNGEINNIWRLSYGVIGSANLVIKYVPLVDDPDFTMEERDNAVAQAKFLRALIHFQMANWWAQPIQLSGGTDPAVPLVLEPFDDEVQYPSRASLNEVYAQVEQDLLEAIPDLNNLNPTRASRGAAQALLARLYLYQDRFDEAVDLANQVIQSPEYGLASDYSFYNTLSSEFIFTLFNSTDDFQIGNPGYSSLTNPANVGGRGDAPFSDDLLSAFASEPGDLRFSSLIQMGSDAAGNTRTFTSKYPDAIGFSDNAPVIRITEMYLTRAEANFRNGSSIGDSPLNDINMLRSRAGLTSLVSLDLDAILNERRKELCFEGHRRMDLLRNLMNLRRPGMPNEADSAPGQPKVILPIPVNELDLNENLVQNPGY